MRQPTFDRLSARKHENTKTRRRKHVYLFSWFRGFVLSCVLPVLIGTLTGCTNPGPPVEKNYASRIAAERATKDASFAATNDPVPTAAHAKFLPLAYFPIDPAYNVP